MPAQHRAGKPPKGWGAYSLGALQTSYKLPPSSRAALRGTIFLPAAAQDGSSDCKGQAQASERLSQPCTGPSSVACALQPQ